MDILLTSVRQSRYVTIKSESLEEIKLKISPIKLDDIPKNKQGVYLLSCVTADKRSYSGKAEDLFVRINRHKYSEKPKQTEGKVQVITKAIRRYGWNNFEIRLLEVFDEGTKTDFELLDLEEAYIKYYRLLIKDDGYNILARGRSTDGYKHTEESKKKMSERRMGIKLSKETCKNISKSKTGEKNPNFGKKCSKETKDKIRAANSGINSPNYGKSLTDKRKAQISLFFKEKKQSPEFILKRTSARKIPINQLDKISSELIKTWPSAKDAGEGLLISKSDITAVCNGRQKSAHGFKWEYFKVS